MLQCQNGCNWLCQVKSILLSLGFGDVWYSQHVNHIEWFLKCVKMRLTDNFIHERDTILDNSSKCNIYKHLIDRFCLQYYLNISMPNCYTMLITRFRVSAHTLLIEKGRYHNIERDKRLCQMCDMNDVEDEYHFIFIRIYDIYILRNITGPNPLFLNLCSYCQCKIERNYVI